MLQISYNCIKIHLLINNTDTLPHSIQLTPSINNPEPKPNFVSNAQLGEIYQFSWLLVRKQRTDSDQRILKKARNSIGATRKLRKWFGRRTITNQSVRRRNPTPHEFPAGWTIKSERVCTIFLESNGETWINSVFHLPTPFQPSSTVPRPIDLLLFFPRVQERARLFLATNRIRRGQRDVKVSMLHVP